MVAVCQAEEFQAIALAKSSGGTRLANSDDGGRPEEGARHAEQREHGEDRQPGLSRPRSVRAAAGQRAARLDQRRQRHDQAAAEAVGDDAGDQHQQQRRQELDDADNAEVEGIARQIVDLPADRDRDDLGAKVVRKRALQ